MPPSAQFNVVCHNNPMAVMVALAATLESGAASVETMPDLANLLRVLRRREACRRVGSALTYRELAARTGWSHAIIGEYLAGTALPPTDRFDQLILLLGASAAERAALATARDRVEELRRPRRTVMLAQPAVPLVRTPRELPPPAPVFVGRQPQLDQLDRIAGLDPGALTIAAICGGGGVGKTELAVQWTHQQVERFPDGQLYVDLRGYGPTEPIDPGDALARFLAALGVQSARLPAGTDERAARYRTMLARRRMLIVLDNAESADHVRPLLPGSPTCMVIVTSRDSLAGLVAAEGAHRIELGVLTEPESVALRHALLGDDASWALHCGRLPLALQVAAQEFASDPVTRVDVLSAGDGAVRSSLSWSYDRLTPLAARLFRLLGTAPLPEVSVEAAAMLAGVPVVTVRQLLGELVRAYMLAESRPGRYVLHDVLRAYAAERLASEERAGLTAG